MIIPLLQQCRMNIVALDRPLAVNADNEIKIFCIFLSVTQVCNNYKVMVACSRVVQKRTSIKSEYLLENVSGIYVYVCTIFIMHHCCLI